MQNFPSREHKKDASTLKALLLMRPEELLCRCGMNKTVQNVQLITIDFTIFSATTT